MHRRVYYCNRNWFQITNCYPAASYMRETRRFFYLAGHFLFPIKLNGPDVAMNFCFSLCSLRDVSKIHHGNLSHMLDTNRNSCQIAVNFNLTIKRWLLFSAGNAQLGILNKIATKTVELVHCVKCRISILLSCV